MLIREGIHGGSSPLSHYSTTSRIATSCPCHRSCASRLDLLSCLWPWSCPSVFWWLTSGMWSRLMEIKDLVSANPSTVLSPALFQAISRSASIHSGSCRSYSSVSPIRWSSTTSRRRLIGYMHSSSIELAPLLPTEWQRVVASRLTTSPTDGQACPSARVQKCTPPLRTGTTCHIPSRGRISDQT